MKPYKTKKTVLVRYGKFDLMGHFSHSEPLIPSIKCKVIVQTNRGLEMGEIISPSAAHNRHTCTISKARIDQYVKQAGSNYPLSRQGRLVRVATTDDLNEFRHIQANSRNEIEFSKQASASLGLPLKIVDVDHLFGGDRIIVYFKAEHRVDFRELCKVLKAEFKTRVELRQIGARDEAKLLGDCDTCGRELCCKRFLKVLQPVNLKMAKRQHLPLVQEKMAGACGRLKCCIRYENVDYMELEKRLPRINQKVLTEQGEGIVLDTMVSTQLIKLRLLKSNDIIAINVDELIQPQDRQPAPQK